MRSPRPKISFITSLPNSFASSRRFLAMQESTVSSINWKAIFTGGYVYSSMNSFQGIATLEFSADDIC